MAKAVFRADGTAHHETACRALEALKDLSIEKGINDISMRYVPKRLGISLAALKDHYPSTATLLGALRDAVAEEYPDMSQSQALRGNVHRVPDRWGMYAAQGGRRSRGAQGGSSLGADPRREGRSRCDQQVRPPELD